MPPTSAPPGVVAAKQRFTVELLDGRDLGAAGWPSIEADPRLRMYVYQSREFLEVWMASIGKARRVSAFLVIVRDRTSRPALYLPLVVETHLNTRVLRFMDAGVADFNAPILSAEHPLTREDFLTIWAEILARLHPIDLIDLKKIASEVDGMRNPLTYLTCKPRSSGGHAIDLSAWSQSAAESLSIGRMRKKLRRQQQRLDRLGTTQFLVQPTRSQARLVLDRLMALKREQYLRTFGRDLFSDPGIREFYTRMAAPEQLGTISNLSGILCGDKVISAHLGFTGRGRFYYVLPAFDIAYRSLAVGILLLDHLVERCAGERYDTFDLGEGDFPYKSKWATHRLLLSDHERALTSRGALIARLRQLRQLARVDRLRNIYAGTRAAFAPAPALEKMTNLAAQIEAE